MTPSANSEGDGLDLRHYFGVFRRRWWIVVACTVVTAAAALGASLLQTDVYEAKATLLIQQRTSDTLFNPTTGQANDPQRAVDTEVQVAESLPVRAAVQKKLGNDVPSVSASVVGTTNVIELSVHSTDPALAAKAVNEYANAYVEFKRSQAVDDVLGAAKEVQQKITQLQAQLSALPADSSQRSSLEQQIALFQQQLDQLQVGASIKTGGAQLIAEADVPTSPVEPKPIRNAALGAALGLLLGIGLAFLVDFFDDRIRSKEDVESVAEGLPVLGLIPSMPGWRKPAEEHLATIELSASPVAEAYRSVRTSIQFMGIEDPIKVLQVTSAVPGEGKTTTAANLAVVFARGGARTVLIDCDLRRPRLHRFFGLSGGAVGLTDVVVGHARLDEAVQPARSEPHLWVLAAGTSVPNPSELLASAAFQRLLDGVTKEADFVILDSPPILPVTDGLVVANRADATMLITTADQTTRRNLQRSLELLSQVGAPVIGTVLNCVAEQQQYGYQRYGAYGHGPRQEHADTSTS